MHQKAGILIPDFDALRRNAQAYDAFITTLKTLRSDGLIILSAAPVISPANSLAAYIKTAFVTDTRLLSPARLNTLCQTLYRYENGALTNITLSPSHAAPKGAHIGLFVSNGFGLGHVTRMRALAHELSPHAPCTFLSLSAGLVDGACYAPSPQYLDIKDAAARQYMHELVLRFFNHANPTHIIYDGNILPDGLLSALSLRPHIHLTWLRRGMWPNGAGAKHMPMQALCDVVLEPGDVADAADNGPSWRTRMDYCPPKTFLKTAPIRPLMPPHLPREVVREQLGLTPNARYALIMLGATQKQEDANTLNAVLSALRGHYQPVIAHWPMSHAAPPRLNDAITLERQDIQTLYPAFDVILSAAGYNSFHELLCTDIPLVFIPQEDEGRDQQLARAQFATAKGWSALCRRTELETLPQILTTLTPQCRPNVAFHTDTPLLLGALNIPANTEVNTAQTSAKTQPIKPILKAMHKRLKNKGTAYNFVLANTENALKKCDPKRDVIITNTISPVALRRAGFKYLWVNALSPWGTKRQLKTWLNIWRPTHIKSV